MTLPPIHVRVVAGLALVHLAVLAAMSWGGVDPSGYGLVQAVLTIAGMATLRRHHARLAKGSVCAWIGAAAGPLGMLAGLAIGSRRWGATRPLPAPSWLLRERFAEAAQAVSLERLLDQRIIQAPRTHFVSFESVFRHGDVADRASALQTVVRRFEPRLAGVVARALRDPDATVRAQAASASAEILARFRATRERLHRAVALADDPQASMALARFLTDHARHNVLLSAPHRASIAAEADAIVAALAPRPVRSPAPVPILVHPRPYPARRTPVPVARDPRLTAVVHLPTLAAAS